MSKVLVLGNSGREDALGQKLEEELGEDNVLYVPGSARTEGRRYDISLRNFYGLYKLARDREVDIVLVGPEKPLCEGIVDFFQLRKPELAVFGPNMEAAIERSKVFQKIFFGWYDIPTAVYAVAYSPRMAAHHAKDFMARYGKVVLKPDGLTGGKGVVVCRSKDDVESGLKFMNTLGKAADSMVVEKCLEGEEVSFCGFSDGNTVVPLLATQDHKPVYDNDKGPNTGGMGAYTRPAVATQQVCEKMEEILDRIVHGLRKEQRTFRGLIYGGFMITNGEPYALEVNCRFPGSETEAMIGLADFSLVEMLHETARGSLRGRQLKWKPGEGLSVALATEGYPGDYKANTGKKINGLDRTYPDVKVYHAGTGLLDGNVVNTGGRVLHVTGFGRSLPEAYQTTYSAIGPQGMHFEGMHYRKDIGRRSLPADFIRC